MDRIALFLLGLLAPAPTGSAPDRTGSAPAEPLVDGTAALIPMALTNGRTMDMEFADLDGDGHGDIVLAVEFGQNAILFHEGGEYVHRKDALPQDVLGDSEDIAIADLNGDGDPDLVFACEDTQRNEVYLNDGRGRFTDVSDRLPVTGTSNSVAAFDADGDGDVDLLFGNKGQNELVWNDGEARFTLAADALPRAEDVTQDVELGDLDGDGDLDVVLGNEDANRVLRNEGDGTFTDVTEAWLGWRREEETREADLGDVDGDGDLDLWLANVGWAGHDPQDALLLNDGHGRLTPAPEGRLPAMGAFHVDVDLVDLDGDGDLDAVLARLAPGLGRPADVLLNDGQGTFTPLDVVPASAVGHGIDVEVVDLDHDGHLDIYVATHLPCDRVLLGRESY